MRDPKRIEPTLALVERYWKSHPDWRLSQLVVNVAQMGNDPFYCEDDQFRVNLELRLAEEAK